MRFIYTRAFAILFVCLVVLVMGLFLQVKGYLEPVQYVLLHSPQPVIRIVKGVTDPVQNFFGNLFTVRKIVSDNTRLTAQVAELQTKVAGFDALKSENEAFKKELGFVQASPPGLQPCTVLSSDPENLTDTLVLNCGKDKGITEGQAVIAQGYLVAKIIFVNQSTSTALLIINSQSTVDARISGTDTEGVVKGSFGSGVLLDLVSQNADLKKGSLIVTAGINSSITPNIPIGQVGDTISKPNELFKRASIATPVRFHEIYYVFVAKR